MRWSRPRGPERRPTAGGPGEIAALAAAALLFALIAGALTTRDLDLQVYRQAAQRTFDARVDPYPRRDADGLPFTYPPTALFLLYPFSRLDPAAAAGLMWRLNLLLVPVLGLLLVRDLAGTRPATGAAAAADRITGRRLRTWGPLYVASFGAVYLTLHFHQINLPILLCLWLYWRQVRLGRAGYGAGVALALGSVAKPHYGLLLLAALQRPRSQPGCERVAEPGVPSTTERAEPHPLRRALRPWFGAAGGGLLLLALSLVIAPPGSWGSWLTLVPGTTSYTELPPGHSTIAAPWNRSIPGAVARLLIPNKFSQPLLASPAAAALLSLLLVATLAAATLWLLADSIRAGWRTATAPPPGIIDLQLSLLSVLVFLAAPASWTHHLVMLLPAALVLLRDAVLDPRSTLGSRLAGALVLVVLALTLDDLIPREQRVSSHAIMGLMTVAVLALWCLLMQRLYRLRRAGERT